MLKTKTDTTDRLISFTSIITKTFKLASPRIVRSSFEKGTTNTFTVKASYFWFGAFSQGEYKYNAGAFCMHVQCALKKIILVPQ